jgi:hypothetical protein
VEQTKPPLCANIVLCETVINEYTGTQTFVRTFSHLTLDEKQYSAQFFSVTLLTSLPGDLINHVLSVRMVDASGQSVATAPDRHFAYAYRIDPAGPGGFSLTTKFTVDVTKLASLGTYLIEAWLDGSRVAQAPLTLRRN